MVPGQERETLNLKTEYSPYDIINEANRLIDICINSSLTKEQELQIILLINKAQSYTNMSKYQLSTTRKRFAELYYSLGITGNALDQYKLAIELNSKLPIKRVLHSLEKIPQCDLVYSLDTNTYNEPDYSNIKRKASKIDADILKKQEQLREKQAAFLGIDTSEYKEFETNTRNKITMEVITQDNIYDPEFEEMLNRRIEKLDDISKMAFQQVRDNMKSDDVLSIKDRLLLTIEALERSQQYHEETSATEQS